MRLLSRHHYYIHQELIIIRLLNISQIIILGFDFFLIISDEESKCSSCNKLRFRIEFILGETCDKRSCLWIIFKEIKEEKIFGYCITQCCEGGIFQCKTILGITPFNKDIKIITCLHLKTFKFKRNFHGFVY